MEESPETEKELVKGAIKVLRELLPANWSVGTQRQATTFADLTGAAITLDQITLQSPQSGGAVAVLVEARRSFTPRDVAQMFSGLAGTYRAVNPNNQLLVVAPWLSRRTRDLLEQQEINYIDLTGNVRIALTYPGVFIRSPGSDRDPSPKRSDKPSLKGPRAGRLVRTLLDVVPPYGVSELASATGLAIGYVSRIIGALADDALIDRDSRKRVISIDLPALVHRWVDSYALLDSNKPSSFVAPAGPASALDQLASISSRVAITGSFAAKEIAPVAGPALLVAYTERKGEVANDIRLLPTDIGANVILLEPFDQVVWVGTWQRNGARYVSASQIAADCLTGTGRMPAEGEAVLDWMTRDRSWQTQSLNQLGTSWVGSK